MGKRRTIPPLEELSQDSARFVEDVQQETDRGVALVAVAFLEDVLGALIRTLCIDDPDAVRSLLNRHWSIDTRADLAYCLGLIPRGMRDDIEVITGIRNHFGHGHRPASFTDPEVFKECERLGEFKADVEVTVGDPPSRPPRLEGRGRFISSVVMLTMLMLTRALGEEGARRRAAAEQGAPETPPPTPPPPTPQPL